MRYQRKTKDIYLIQGNYGCGWETLFEEDTPEKAKEQLKCYNENEKEYLHRIKKTHEKITNPE